MTCDCPICKGRDINKEGVKVSVEIIDFIKDTLNLDHRMPFPRKYDKPSAVSSIMAYSQALAFNRAHGIEGIYYTDNPLLLKVSKELGDKYGMPTDKTENVPENHYDVCEFNTEL